jgi:hypothetical protein
MQLFHLIDDGVAIIRVGGTLFKQVKVYHRGSNVFIAHAGGFARVTAKFGDSYGTSAPNVRVLELEASDVKLRGSDAPIYLGE